MAHIFNILQPSPSANRSNNNTISQGTVTPLNHTCGYRRRCIDYRGSGVVVRSLIGLRGYAGWLRSLLWDPTGWVRRTLISDCAYAQPDQCPPGVLCVIGDSAGIGLIRLRRCSVWSGLFYALMWFCRDRGGLAFFFVFTFILMFW